MKRAGKVCVDSQDLKSPCILVLVQCLIIKFSRTLKVSWLYEGKISRLTEVSTSPGVPHKGITVSSTIEHEHFISTPCRIFGYFEVAVLKHRQMLSKPLRIIT